MTSPMPARPKTHRPLGWRQRKAWERSTGQVLAENPLPRGWAKLRQLVLWEEPLCRPCQAAGVTTASVEVDHIIPRSRGGSSKRSNLQGICIPCHRDKTAREAQAGSAMRISVRGNTA
jgi:5-methylcytosine-specific restriction protein A